MQRTSTQSEYYPTTREQRSGLGNTPLIAAAVEGSLEKVHGILDKFPEHSRYIDLQDSNTGHDGYENTALILAVFGGHAEMAIKLIDCGAKVTVANNRGITPLHYACIRRDHQLIEKLLSKGARWDAKNKDGVSPLDFYLFEWGHFPYEEFAIRELALISEHRPDNSGILNNRPRVNEDLLRKYNLSLYQTIIPELIKKVIPELVAQASLIYVIENPKQFNASIFAYAFDSYETFLHEFKKIQVESIDPKQLKQKMLEITKGLLEDKYGQPRQYEYTSKPVDLEIQKGSSSSNISMMVLGGFIAAIGIAAVAVAFTVLNAASFGISGLFVVVVGGVVSLSGIGIFAIEAAKKPQHLSDELPSHGP